jgi:hypothetical protein
MYASPSQAKGTALAGSVTAKNAASSVVKIKPDLKDLLPIMNLASIYFLNYLIDNDWLLRIAEQGIVLDFNV